MDAKKMFYTVRRLCDAQKLCMTCPLGCGAYHRECMFTVAKQDPAGYADECAAKIEKWGEENPAKTYLQDFAEKFPIVKGREGELCDCNCRRVIYNKDTECMMDGECEKCWNTPMEEES